jgi:RimJ/RimL family protein N-acetyltransferase
MLEGKLIRLRPLEARDMLPLARWRNDPDAFRWFSSPAIIAESEQAAWYERYTKDATQRQWMMVDGDGATVGTLALINIDYHHQSAEVARVLVDGAQRGKGYGGEALRLLFRYAFDEMNLQRLSVVVFSDNERGKGLYISCGFVAEGILRRAAWKAGAFRDLTMLSLLRRDDGK